jgi:hypothetical protein
MTPTRTKPDPLVMTEAETVPPPDVTVPEPAVSAPRSSSPGGSVSPELLRDIKALADRVGGLEKLRDLVATLLEMRP